ncbi:GNAT family N-acetyltransferase [bacterium]|nr:GNAT family N-acetyltransferase [bacterium]
MQIRTFQGVSDFAEIMSLAILAPIEQLSATALPYQLSSWALDDPGNVGLWADEKGSLVAAALMQVPFHSLLYCVHPQVEQYGLTDKILEWGIQRANSLADISGTPYTFSVFVDERDPHLTEWVKSHGFVQQGPDRVFLVREGKQPPVRNQLPTGFSIRQLAGADETIAASELLCAAFNISTMTPTWRYQILTRREYRPELDIVVESPKGELASFCLGWLNPQGKIGQIEPMGTCPTYQRIGLAREALVEVLQRLHELEAERVIVGTSAANARSLPLYQSVGFELHHRKCTYQYTST